MYCTGGMYRVVEMENGWSGQIHGTWYDIRDAEVQASNLAVAMKKEFQVRAPSGTVVIADKEGFVQVAY